MSREHQKLPEDYYVPDIGLICQSCGDIYGVRTDDDGNCYACHGKPARTATREEHAESKPQTD